MNETKKLKKAGISSPSLCKSSWLLMDLGASGILSSRTSKVMEMAKMPSVSASMRPLESSTLRATRRTELTEAVTGQIVMEGFLCSNLR